MGTRCAVCAQNLCECVCAAGVLRGRAQGLDQVFYYFLFFVQIEALLVVGKRCCTVPAEIFVRRFLSHVLIDFERLCTPREDERCYALLG